jgi:iron(III) transport system ATP-binding protein
VPRYAEPEFLPVAMGGHQLEVLVGDAARCNRCPIRIYRRIVIDITLENVTKRFGAVVAVDRVWLEIRGGEVFFLLGPSGCGKTTLLRCVAGFCRPEAGAVRFADRDVTDLPPHLRNTGMVFQNYALWPHMTVSENVAFGLRVRKVSRGERRRRVDKALDIVQMTTYAARKPNELSGGQQQRVALARALVIEPQCLLLDEPLSNLDAKLRLEMRGEIRRICKRAGLTAIYVTHDQKEALSIADRIALLNEGRVEQIGTPHELYARPANRFVADFLGETNFVEGKLSSSGPEGCEVRTSFGVVRARGPLAPRPEGEGVLLSIRPEGVHIGPPPAGAVNVFEGTLGQTVYLGELAQRELALSSGAVFKVTELKPRIDLAGRVQCWFDPADVVVLER